MHEDFAMSIVKYRESHSQSQYWTCMEILLINFCGIKPVFRFLIILLHQILLQKKSYQSSETLKMSKMQWYRDKGVLKNAITFW